MSLTLITTSTSDKHSLDGLLKRRTADEFHRRFFVFVVCSCRLTYELFSNCFRIVCIRIIEPLLCDSMHMNQVREAITSYSQLLL